MAVIIRSSNTLANDDLWNEWSDQLQAVIYDEDVNKNDDDKLVSALFNEDKSKKFAEKQTTLGTLGNFSAKAEGADAAEDEFEEGYSKMIQHTTFSKTVTLSRELVDDGRAEVMKAKTKGLVKAYKRSRAAFASALLTGGTATTFTYEGATYDSTTGDGKAIFAVDHPEKSDTSITQSNLFSNALTDAVILNKLANIMRNYKDDRDHVMGLLADTIVIPGNAPALEDLVKKIIGSDGEVGTNNNDINTQRGRWKLVIDHLWTPTVAAGAATPYIIMSSEANKDLLGNRFYDRVALDVKGDVKTESRNLIWNGYCRFSAGCTNFRHMLMGGVSTGSTIS